MFDVTQGSLTVSTVARVFGGEARGTHACIPGPGHSRKDRSLSVWIDPAFPEGFWCTSFAGDDPILCRDHVRAGMGLPAFSSQRPRRDRPGPAAAQIEVARKRALDAAVDEERKFGQAMAIWRETVNPVGTLVEAYLASRALRLVPEVVEGGHLRFHPRCPVMIDGKLDRFPAMVCLMTDAITSAPLGIHRTYLADDGTGKRAMPDSGQAKRMLGRAKGTVIRLSPDEDVTMGLGLSEGIEEGLTALNDGWSPVWAAGSANTMSVFPVLAGIESLTLIADYGDAGERAADMCAQRWADAGREAAVKFPTGADWNDTFRRGGP